MFGLSKIYHGFWLDQEHALISTEQLHVASLAGRAHGLNCFVRVPPTGYWQVTQCLEAGAGGVMGAQIQSAEHAEQFVSWCKFSPRGTRGFNTTGRDADFGHMPPADFVQKANQESFVAIQIETLGSLEDADAIAAIEDVDLLFVGPADLSLAMGIPGQFDDSRLWEGIGHVIRACKRHGKAWGCVAPNPGFASRAVENGCRMPTMGNDVVTLRRGIEAIRAAFSDVFDA
jgi:2-dehydro-3-deoxyglucarate aldolase/4-hydroxy-2-oxoheptanedioate aldolase